MTTQINIDLDYISDDIAHQLSHDELFDFIKTLDLKVADWGFTEMLINYFEQEKIKMLKEKEII